MPITVVIGLQWGDEGKGKIVDYLSQRANIVARFNGGPNAGHTVQNKYGKFILHHIPSGIFNPKCLCIIGNGVVIDPEILFKEIEGLKARGITVGNRLKISHLSHLILPWHKLLDEAEEKRRGDLAIGTTKRGIGPAFADKFAREGIRLCDLWSKDLEDRLRLIHDKKLRELKLVYGCTNIPTFPEIYNLVLQWRSFFEPYICDTQSILKNALKNKQNILLEGAQGTLLDVDFGTYPNSTSSVCTVAGAFQGTGLLLTNKIKVVGVVKAYTTRVGSEKQPFPTEMPKDLSFTVRQLANEYGATTGRPRRIGWLDAMLVKYSAKINGVSELAITRLDSLAGISPLKICIGYRLPNGNKLDLNTESLRLTDLDSLEPIYEVFEGWENMPFGIKTFNDLPKPCQDYIKAIERFIGVPVGYISYGPERNNILRLNYKT